MKKKTTMKKFTIILLILVSIHTNAQVSPFLTTTWNQTCNYNAMMPSVGTGGACGNAYTGCNSTALAQIFKYYTYPAAGFGSHCNSLAPTECVDYSIANYDYSVMPNNVTAPNIEVATLMYDIGVAVDMNWSGTNSTSFFSSTVLKEYFAYSPKVYSTATFMFSSTAELIEGIKIELDNERPVFAKGGGHFYLIDGYDLADQFHMNFGWGGVYDDYYAIDNVINGAGTFTPTNFIFNIEPLQGDLETAVDTIYISANGVSSESVEFTSLLEWTSTSSSWVNLNLVSGTEGYYNFNNGSHFAASLNNGQERVGYVIIENTNDIDSIVVVQAASPLVLTPNPVNFISIGGVETISIEYTSWLSWIASENSSWLSVSTATGTGDGAINLSCADNSGGGSRSAYLVVDGGSFIDSILVTQDADITAIVQSVQINEINIYPNPTTGSVFVSSTDKFSIYDVLGNKLDIEIVVSENNSSFSLSPYSNGIYFIKVNDSFKRIIKSN